RIPPGLIVGRNAFFVAVAGAVGIALMQPAAGGPSQSGIVATLSRDCCTESFDQGIRCSSIDRGRGMGARRRRFAQRRKAVGFSQERFAERLRIDRSTVARWE